VRIGIITFPGSNGDWDCYYALREIPGFEPVMIWHKERDLHGVSALILPGGFAHGDYLRAGAIARFSPIMHEVTRFASEGRPVIGICNGFQILTEAHLLPGALIRNKSLLFRCSLVHVRVKSNRSPWLSSLREGEVLRLAIAHGQGNYFADQETLNYLLENDMVALQYCGPNGEVTPEFNHNGSVMSIAGITNEAGNVLGLMPHPERSADQLLGSADGRRIFMSLAVALKEVFV